jgi:tryptophan-rich sensory protein
MLKDMKSKPVRFIASLLLVYAAAAIGSVATFPAIPNWYASLDKPWFNPPNSIFGPVWTVLYTLMGISLYLVWTAKTKQSKRRAYIFFGVQLVLNSLWSIVFFGLQQLWPAVAVIAGLWLAIAATMYFFWPISRRAVYLLLPYIAWVTFASILTISIAALNA